MRGQSFVSVTFTARAPVFVVIFRAVIKDVDQEYLDTARRMRTLALERYGCLEFHSCCENGLEIALSYWPDEDAIRGWKQDPEHRTAQEMGRRKWYQDYRVEVAEVTRAYDGSARHGFRR